MTPKPYITAEELFQQAKLQADARDAANRNPKSIFPASGIHEAVRCDITREWLEDAAREINRLNGLLYSLGKANP